MSARSTLPALFHAVVFLAAFGLWTWKLLDEHPVPASVAARFTPDTWFVAAKSLHFSAYAFLAVLTVALPVPRAWCWSVVGVLALHAIATEIGQTFVPGRTGSVRDVLIDWAGIGTGVGLWYLVRGRRRPEPGHQPDGPHSPGG